jgi:polysaccharide export outer membrane protein
MIRRILFFCGLLISSLVNAQTGTNTNTNKGNTNPNGSSPYTNPYGTNPYLDPSQQNTNFFENVNTDNNQNGRKGENSTNNTQIDKSKLNQQELQDLNNLKNQIKDENKSDEDYVNDPDYQNYLNSINTAKLQKSDSLAKKDSLRKKIYGMDFFTNNVFELSDKNNSAPPMDYRLGPGDELIVSLWGGAELQQNYTLGKDGSIFPKLVGKIYLQGLTFDAASSVITSKFKRIVPASTNIDVQMGKSRTIKVTIVGEVKKQGTYTISAYNTALNALFRAGGVTDIGNLRKIEIKRDGRTVEILDLYSYLQKGRQADEIYLEDNDFIFVSVYDKLVNAQGNFKRPMYYQLTEDEGLHDLIDFAGGLSSEARNSLIHIKTITNEEEHYVDIPWAQYTAGEQNSGYENDYVLKDGDVVAINPINKGLRNTVFVEGAVNYPDEYEIRQGERLTDVLRRAGGLASTAYLPSAYIMRGSNGVNQESFKIDLTNLTEVSTSNIEINLGDRIKILSNKEFDQKYEIEVFGFVRKPGKIPYYKNMRLKDVLLLSGGLRLDAEDGRIEISNIVDSATQYNITSRGSNIRIVSINANLEIDQASEEIVIKPLDKVFVRRKAEFLNQERVTLIGEVMYPGEYVLIDKNEKLSSLIKRAGGIKQSAFAEGSKLIRSKVGYVVIDLPSALIAKGSKNDIILRDSDVVIVPTINDIVSVRGEVQNQVNIKFDREATNVKHYLGAAGGLGENPWKARINVKYQNGRIRNTKNFLFFHIYPPVREGSIVTVPVKPKKENKTKFTEIFSYSLSAITSLATLIVLAKSLN